MIGDSCHVGNQKARFYWKEAGGEKGASAPAKTARGIAEEKACLTIARFRTGRSESPDVQQAD